MDRSRIFETKGYVIAATVFLLSMVLFYTDTSAFWGSLFAALMAAGLAWVSYVLLRIFYLAIRR